MLVEPQAVLILAEQMEEPDQTKAMAAVAARRVILVMVARLVEAALQVERQVPAVAVAAGHKVFFTVKEASVVVEAAPVAVVLAYLVKVLAEPLLIKMLLSILNPQDAEVLAEQMVVLVALILNQVWAVLMAAEVVGVVALEEALEPFVLFGPDARAHFPQPV